MVDLPSVFLRLHVLLGQRHSLFLYDLLKMAVFIVQMNELFLQIVFGQLNITSSLRNGIELLVNFRIVLFQVAIVLFALFCYY